MDTEVLRKLSDSMRVAVSDEELAVLAQDFTSVLKLVNELDEVELPDTAPVYLVKNVTRDDVPMEAPRDVHDAIIREFPGSEGDLLKVPSIL